MVNKLIKEAKKNGINLEVLTSIKNIATKGSVDNFKL